MSDNQKPDEEENPYQTLDCTGAGMCQPLPDETTDGGKQQAMVQKSHDKRRSRKRVYDRCQRSNSSHKNI